VRRAREAENTGLGSPSRSERRRRVCRHHHRVTRHVPHEDIDPDPIVAPHSDSGFTKWRELYECLETPVHFDCRVPAAVARGSRRRAAGSTCAVVYFRANLRLLGHQLGGRHRVTGPLAS